MPRYLGRDFLAEYLREKLRNQEDILRLQLPNPEHLEVQRSYIHCGILPDEVYRKPWQRVKLEKHQLSTDGREVIQQGLVGLPTSFNYLETLNREFRGVSVSDFNEIVPSSNPESQESLSDGCAELICARKRKLDEITSEVFTPYCLQEDEKAQDELSLEDVQGGHRLHHFARFLPSVEVLVTRLRPLAVQDPLRSDENHVFGLDKVYSSQSRNLQEADQVPKNPEIFSRIKTCNFDYELLEDELTLDTEKTTQEALLDSRRQDLKEALGYLTEEQLDDPETVTDLLQNTEEKKLHALSVNTPEVLEHKSGKKSPDFNELNNQGLETDDSSLWERSCLESPTIAQVSIETLDTMPWKDLQELPVDKPGDWSLLQIDQKNAMEQSFWLCQKFHDSRFMHRLREPQTRGTFGDRLTFKDICKLLDLEAEICDELHLQWVPVDYCDVASTAIVSVEPFSDQKSCLVVQTDFAEVEDISKHDLNPLMTKTDTEEALPPPLIEQEDMFKITKRKNVGNIGAGESPRKLKARHPEISKILVVPPPVSTDPLDSFLWMKQQQPKNRSHNQRNGEGQQYIYGNTDNGKGGTLMEKQVKQSIEEKSTSSTCDLSSKSQSAAPIAPEDVVLSNALLYSEDIATIQVTGDYLKPSLQLRDGAKPLLQKLQSHGLLPSNQSLSALTPAITRFILKQHEKSCEMTHQGQEKKNPRSGDVYSTAVGLHALVDALHSLLHGCLPLAAAQMAEVQQRYGVLPHGLEKLRHSLFETHMQFEQQHVRHPKILTMCERLSRWMTNFANRMAVKVMVVMNRRSSCLANTLREGLMMVEGMKPDIYPLQEEMTPTQVTKMLGTCNCLIISGPQVTSNFPLAQFTFVVEYEHTQRSTIKKACQASKVSYLGLELDTKAVFMREETNGNNSAGRIQRDDSEELVLIGSHNVTMDSQLLHVLEGRNNILVIERDYQGLMKPGSQIGFADLILDECSCIVLQNIADLEDVRSASPLTLQLAHLSNKYVNCWLILHSHNVKGNSKQKYPYAGMVPSTLARLHSGISHLSASVQGYNIQVLHSTTSEQTGDLVRQIAETACAASRVWTKDQWIERTWISLVMSKHERLLLQIPCISSFSAQILLKVFAVDQLFTADVPELVKCCPWLSPRILQAFWEYLHSEVPVPSEVPSSPQYPFPPHTAGGDHAEPCHGPYAKASSISKRGSNMNYQLHKENGRVEHDISEVGQNTLTYEDNSLDNRGIPNQVSLSNEIIKTLPSQLDLPSDMEQDSQTFNGNGQEISAVVKPKCHSYGTNILEADPLMDKAEETSVSGGGPSRFYNPVEYIPDMNSKESGQQLPNEYERACLENRHELLEQTEKFHHDLQEIENFVAQELDVHVTSPEKKFFPSMLHKRPSDFESEKYINTPVKIQKVETPEDNSSFNAGTKADMKYGTRPNVTMYPAMYPENLANKYRNYPNRKNLHLWTQFGDDLQRPSGYQQRSTLQPSQGIMPQPSPHSKLSKRISTFREEPHEKVEGIKMKQGLNFTHRYSGSKISGSVSRNSNNAKPDTAMVGDEGDVEKRVRHSLAACDITRGIAPVTPKVRHPVHVLQRTDELAYSRNHMHETREQHIPDTVVGDSPPMDLSQGDQDFDFYQIDSSRMIQDQMVPGPSGHRFNNILDEMCITNHTPVAHEPKRKLVYQKVPGAPKGQTRLSFE